VSVRQFPGEVLPIVLRDTRVLVVTSMKRLGPVEMDLAPELSLIVTTTSGTDHLDLDAARARGIAVARCPMARRDAVVESSLGMILALLRDLPRLQGEAREGRWVRADLPGRGIERLGSLSVGVVGLGVIGARMVEILRALGARVHGFDPRVHLEGIEVCDPVEMFRSCRVVTLHCALERGRPPVVGRACLEAARPDLILVNTARGGVLDLDAADEALRAGRLGGLGIDVFPREPWPDMGLLAAHARVLLTPHGAGWHEGLGEAIADELVACVSAWIDGRPLPHRVA
jgi:D-3-phosphoglycerate dehydrogenase